MNKLKIFLWVALLGVFALACEENFEPTPSYKNADATFVATPSTTTVAATKADSVEEVITFTWDDPGYAVGLEKSKFTIRVSSAASTTGKTFTKVFEGVLTGSLLGKEINGMAMGLGAEIGESIVLDVVVVASQPNNNEARTSEVMQITVVPFADLGLSATATTVVLSKDNEANLGTTLNWTTAFSGFTGVKNYQLQYAEGGTNFANPVIENVTTFSRAFTHEELNDLGLGYGIAPDTEGTIEFRIIANNELGQEVTSNVLTVAITPYATSFPPLYGMGAALKGWGPWPDNAVEFVSEEFKKYYGYAYFNSGEAFRFFEQLDWGPTSYNYPYFTTVDPLFENANDGDLNLRFTGTSGWYYINIDLVAKTIEMEASSEPLLYMTGEGVGAWNWDNPVKMTYLRPGVFKVTANFTNDKAFRFFAQADWGPTSYNYPYFTSVTPLFVNANDGDSNFKYVGETGSKTITVDLINKVVAEGDLPGPALFATGAALNGWNWDNPIEFTSISPGVFEATATLTTGEAFRFFAQADWGPTSYNYPWFSSVDANFENANDGDSNLKFIGTTGSYTIRVNLISRTVTLE